MNTAIYWAQRLLLLQIAISVGGSILGAISNLVAVKVQPDLPVSFLGAQLVYQVASLLGVAWPVGLIFLLGFLQQQWLSGVAIKWQDSFILMARIPLRLLQILLALSVLGSAVGHFLFLFAPRADDGLEGIASALLATLAAYLTSCGSLFAQFVILELLRKMTAFAETSASAG